MAVDTIPHAGPSTGSDESPTKLSKPVMYLAILLLAGFLVLTIYLYGLVKGTSEVDWHRMIFLYGGIEAIAFAAAGYLFGREVNRAQAESAEKRADQKAKEADQAKKNGYELKGMILGKAPSADDKGEYGALSADVARSRRGDLDALAARAQELFP